MVKAKGFVAGKVFDVAIVVALLFGASLVAKRLNLGPTILENLRGFGSNVGAGITAPLQGLLEGLGLGGAGLGGAAVELSEGFQRAVTGTLFGEERVFFDDDAQTEPKASIESLAERLAASFAPVAAPQVTAIAEQFPTAESFIERIGQIVNPEPGFETEGLFVITFKDGTKSGVLPLSQASIDFHRNVGNTVTRVN